MERSDEWMRQNLVAQFIHLLKHWLCDMWKNWAHPIDQCWRQALQFSVHFIDLLRILLRCNGFAGIWKAVVDQITKQWPLLFFWCKLGFGKCFGASQFNHWAGHCQLLCKIHFLSHVTICSRNSSLLHRIREDDTSERWLFVLWSAGNPLQYSCLENPMDGGAWWTIVHGVAKGRTWLSDFTHFTYETLLTWAFSSFQFASDAENGRCWVFQQLLVTGGSASMILSVGCCQILMAGHCTSPAQGCHLVCNTNWTTTALYVH